MVAPLSLTVIRRFAARWLLLGGMVIFSTALAGPLQLEPADSPVDNPMKGLVPYAGEIRGAFSAQPGA